MLESDDMSLGSMVLTAYSKDGVLVLPVPPEDGADANYDNLGTFLKSLHEHTDANVEARYGFEDGECSCCGPKQVPVWTGSPSEADIAVWGSRWRTDKVVRTRPVSQRVKVLMLEALGELWTLENIMHFCPLRLPNVFEHVSDWMSTVYEKLFEEPTESLDLSLSRILKDNNMARSWELDTIAEVIFPRVGELVKHVLAPPGGELVSSGLFMVMQKLMQYLGHSLTLARCQWVHLGTGSLERRFWYSGTLPLTTSRAVPNSNGRIMATEEELDKELDELNEALFLASAAFLFPADTETEYKEVRRKMKEDGRLDVSNIARYSMSPDQLPMRHAPGITTTTDPPDLKNDDGCNKILVDQHSRFRNRKSQLYALFCEHGICLGYHMFQNETIGDALVPLLYAENMPAIFLYDTACKVERRLGGRLPAVLGLITCWIDAFHAVNHKCRPDFSWDKYRRFLIKGMPNEKEIDVSAYRQADSRKRSRMMREYYEPTITSETDYKKARISVDKMNSSAAEQFNSVAVVLKYILRNQGWGRAMMTIEVIVNLYNLGKIKKMNL